MIARIAILNVLNDRAHLARFGFVQLVVKVFPHHGKVGGNDHNVQPVNVLKFGFFRFGGTRHTGQLFVHAEEVLESDGGKRLVLVTHAHPFLCLDGLMQTVAVTSADHGSAGKLVYDDDLLIVHDIIAVTLHHIVRFQGNVDMVIEVVILNVAKVFDAEITFGFLHALFGQTNGVILFLFLVIGNGITVSVLLPISFIQGFDKTANLLVDLTALIPFTRNDERSTRLVYQDAIHLVHDRKIQASLHHLRFVYRHVIT